MKYPKQKKKHMVHIPSYIRTLRYDLEMTQEKLARACGKKRADVAKYETGKAMPPANFILRLQRLAGPISICRLWM